MTIPSGTDEELPGTPDGPRRVWRVLTGLGVAALVAAGGYAVASNGSGSHPRAVPTPSPSALPTPIGGYGTGAPDPGSGLLAGQATYGPARTITLSGGDGLPVGTSGDPASCPWPTGAEGEPGCTESHAAVPSVTRLVHAYFPDARITATESVLLAGGGPLWFRQVNAQNHGAELVIRIQRPAPTDRSGSGVLRSTRAIAFYGARVGAYYVYLEVDYRSSADPGILRAMAHDPRLVALH